MLFNHWYHHRGELVVYLRLLDVPVPSVYGPTADENPFESPQLTPRPETMGSPSGFVACCIDQAFTQRGLVAAWLGRLQAAGVADAKPPASEMLEHSQPLAVTTCRAISKCYRAALRRAAAKVTGDGVFFKVKAAGTRAFLARVPAAPVEGACPRWWLARV